VNLIPSVNLIAYSKLDDKRQELENFIDMCNL